MQHVLTSPPPVTSDPGDSPSFNVVIAYEDYETGKHAKHTYDFLSDTLGSECQFRSQMWKFDVLGIPKLREMASADVAEADLVVISCHGDELPESARRWIESWLTGPSKPLALVALFDRRPEDAMGGHIARDYLADVARRGHLEFFAQPDEWPGNPAQRESAPARRNDHRTQHTLRTMAGAIQRENAAVRRDAFE